MVPRIVRVSVVALQLGAPHVVMVGCQSDPAQADPSPPALPAAPRRFAFSSNHGGDFDVFVANVDGSGVRNVSASKGDDLFATWSPDGKWIAYASNRSGGFDLYMCNADGGETRRLDTGLPAASLPSFSPDGTAIAFEAAPAGAPVGIFRIAVSGGAPQRLTDPARAAAGPAWGRDGRIYFVDLAANAAIAWVAADGSSQGVAVPSANALGRPAISYDANTLAFARKVGADTRVFMHDVSPSGDGTETMLMGASDSEPSFSPRGDRLLETTTRFGLPAIVIVGARDGGHVVRVTNDGAIDGAAVFAPNPNP